MASVISTARHLHYARCYIGLGMVNEASDELEAIGWDDHMKPKVLAMLVDLYHAAKNWELMRDMPDGTPLADNLSSQNENHGSWSNLFDHIVHL